MISEFELHAFVDGELADEERERIREAIANSAALRAQLGELQQLKTLVCASYQDAEDQGDQGVGVLEMTS